jgi:enoyl-CoA hydratase/carnithine racemase
MLVKQARVLQRKENIMSERVIYTIENGVADVRLNRPEKMNALDPAMFEGLITTGRELAGIKSLRAVVLSGEGRAFCAGLDFISFQAMAGDVERLERNTMAEDPDSPANFAQAAAFVWNELPVPVIAAIHGVAFGGGLQIALGADIRFVAPDARLSIMEIKWGLVPDMSGTQTMRHLTRLDVAKELAFTGREILGEEAVALGFATHVSEKPFEAAMELAREIATKSPDAVRAAKKLMNSTRLMSLEEGLKLEAQLQGTIAGKANQIEAVQSNIQRRDPKFSDPE